MTQAPADSDNALPEPGHSPVVPLVATRLDQNANTPASATSGTKPAPQSASATSGARPSLPDLRRGWIERRKVGNKRYPVFRWFIDPATRKRGSYYLGKQYHDRVAQARRRGATLTDLTRGQHES